MSSDQIQQSKLNAYAGFLGRDLITQCTLQIDDMLRLDSIDDDNNDIHSFAKAYEHTLRFYEPAVNFEQTVVDRHAKFQNVRYMMQIDGEIADLEQSLHDFNQLYTALNLGLFTRVGGEFYLTALG